MTDKMRYYFLAVGIWNWKDAENNIKKMYASANTVLHFIYQIFFFQEEMHGPLFYCKVFASYKNDIAYIFL